VSLRDAVLLVTGVVALAALAACGQTGPLFLPADAAAGDQGTSAFPADGEEDADDEENRSR